MGYTISTHNGSQYSRDHNIRNEKETGKEAHIDPNGIHEIWLDERIRDAYNRIFSYSQQEYNDKQKRADRKIKDYYSAVKKNGKVHEAYEMIISIGNANEKPDPEVAKDIMKQFVGTWKDRNPNLELIGAYYHADESFDSHKKGVPHVHIDYVPVGHGYATGMSTQVSLNRALEEQGFERGQAELPVVQWERRENKVLEDLCAARGLEVEKGVSKQTHMEKKLYVLTRQIKEAEAKKGVLLELEDIDNIPVVKETNEKGNATGNVIISEKDYKNLVNTVSSIENLVYEREKVENIKEHEKNVNAEIIKDLKRPLSRVPSPVRENKTLFDDVMVLGLDREYHETAIPEKISERTELKREYKKKYPTYVIDTSGGATIHRSTEEKRKKKETKRL